LRRAREEVAQPVVFPVQATPDHLQRGTDRAHEDRLQEEFTTNRAQFAEAALLGTRTVEGVSSRPIASQEDQMPGITLGGALVIAGIVIAILWSTVLGIIVALIGLIAFGGFARGKWY
jgi:hypothetical protein